MSKSRFNSLIGNAASTLKSKWCWLAAVVMMSTVSHAQHRGYSWTFSDGSATVFQGPSVVAGTTDALQLDKIGSGSFASSSTSENVDFGASNAGVIPVRQFTKPVGLQFLNSPPQLVTTTYTIEMVINLGDNGTRRRLMGFYDLSDANGGRGVFLNESGNIDFYTTSSNVITGATLSANTWYQIIFTRNSSGVISCYVNGSLAGTYTDSGNDFLPHPGATSYNIITFLKDNAGYESSGKIAKLSIYNEVLSSSNIQDLFNVAAAGIESWKTTGNSGTTSSSFIGTKDNQPLIFKANNAEAFRIAPSGEVGIGTASPLYKLDVNGALRIGGLSADPAGSAGAFYYNTINNRFKGYANGAWKNFLMEGDNAANVTGIVAIANGGTGSSTKSFVDLTTAQTVSGTKTFASVITSLLATNAAGNNANLYIPTGTGAGSGTNITQFLAEGSSNTLFRISKRGNTNTIIPAGYAYGSEIMGTMDVTEAASGNHPLIAAHIIKPLSITNAGATTTNAASLYIGGPATGVTPTDQSSSLWVASGNTRLGKAGTATGTLSFEGAVSGRVLIQPAAAGASWSLTLPSSYPAANGYMLSANSDGTSSWIPQSIGLNIDTINKSVYTGVLGAINVPYSNFIGDMAGNVATNAYNSNFFGQSAGYGATDAHSANFFGQYAGYGATNAYGANFFGRSAGYNATSALQSNFFGFRAGLNATYAEHSNFFGESSGAGAAYGISSNFFGYFAGAGAANAEHSNFFGEQAGSSATDAANSTFIGKYAGYSASGARNSIFIGPEAGNETTGTKTNNGTNDYSILLGRYTSTGGKKNSIILGGSINTNYISNTADNQFMLAPNITKLRFNSFDYDLATDTLATRAYVRSAGINIDTVNRSVYTGVLGAISVYGSNFIGDFAGNGATNAYNANFFGQYAGYGATDVSEANFLGPFAGYSATFAYESNFFGASAGYWATNADHSNFFGENSGNKASESRYSNFFGEYSGYDATNASYSNFFGSYAGIGATDAEHSNFFGNYAGAYATNADHSTFIGEYAGRNANGARNSIFIGTEAGNERSVNTRTNNGSNDYSILLGHYTSTGGKKNSILLGGSTEAYTYISNTLDDQLMLAPNITKLRFNSFDYDLATDTLATRAYVRNTNHGVSVDVINSSVYTGALGAISVYRSNFIGDLAGNATDARSSNFLGYQAGQAATNASSSNFFGPRAGRYAENAMSSNFFGIDAGWRATNAESSNFFGEYAGYSAINARNSNFFGGYSGFEATNAISSNFFGSGAGLFATNAEHSNFFGDHAGSVATDAAYSTFIGKYAGYRANGARNSIFIGTEAGNEESSTAKTNNGTNDYSILLGRYTRTGGKKNSILLGGSINTTYISNTADNQLMLAPNITKLRFNSFDYDLAADTLATRAYVRSAGINIDTVNRSVYTGALGAINVPNSNFIGDGAGIGATNAHYANFLGASSGYEATNGNSSNFFGGGAGSYAINAEHSNFFGSYAGRFATDANNANFLGHDAGYAARYAKFSNFFGAFAGAEAINAENSNFFGKEAGYWAYNARSSNFFGFGAGYLAMSAEHSNFLGEDAGNFAVSAAYSTFIGNKAGWGGHGARNSIFIGSHAGSFESGARTENGTNDYSILLGRYTSTGEKKNSILLGGSTEADTYISNTLDNQLMLAPNITQLRFNSFDYDLAADTLSTRAYVRNLLGNGGFWSIDDINIFNKNTGNVGIGTVSPTAKFHTVGSLRFESFKNNEQGDSVLTTDTDGNLKLIYMPYGNSGGGSGASYSFENGVQQSNGHVSIGGTMLNPVQLNLNGQPFHFNSGSSRVFSFVANGTFNNTMANYDLTANATKFNMGINQDSEGYGSQLTFNGPGNTDPLWMSRFNASNDASEIRMNIGDEGGSADKFHIGYESGESWNSKFVVQANGQAGVGTFELSGDFSVGKQHGDKLSIGNSEWANKTIITTGINGQSDYTEIKVPGATPNSAYLRINNEGSVGIGTTLTDVGYKLLVNGRIKAVGLRVKAYTNWPDYVFDSTYQLKPLAEVEKFIRANKHLPEMPTADEVDKEGHDVSEIQVKLVQKIEELTLYIIEQEKRVKELEDKNKKLDEQSKQILQLQQQLDELKKLILKTN